jgi:anthranilate phosphoribosyltransferase
VSECRAGFVRTFFLHPSDFGLPRAALADLAGGDPATNAGLAREILDGARGARRDVVVLNAAAALLIVGRVASIREGLQRAAAALDSGAGRDTLARLATLSHGEDLR